MLYAAAEAGKETNKLVRDDLREAAKPTLADWRRRIEPLSDVTAAGYRIYVRKTGVVGIEQSKRKTTGKRPDWGKTQMRKGGIPALEATHDQFIAEMEKAVGRIVDRFNR